MMKKILSLLLALTFILSLTGCSKADKGRILYNLKMEKFITLPEYKGIKIDSESEEFKKYMTEVIDSDIEALSLYVKITEGTLKEGDTANIDYEGKLNGVAFEGGTATGYDLTLGSGTFIPGFEDGLIGKEIGTTVDLNLTFPENYGNEELKGKAVVFTVKINYVSTDEKRTPEDYYSELDCETVDEYYDEVKISAAKNYILTKIMAEAEVKKYSEKDKEYLLNQQMEYMEKYVESNYGMSLEDYGTATGQTIDQIEESVMTSYVEPTMKEQMVIYSIFDKENMTVTDKELKEKTKEYVASYNDSSVTEKVIKEYYGDYFFEYLVVSEKVTDFLYKSAKIS